MRLSRGILVVACLSLVGLAACGSSSKSSSGSTSTTARSSAPTTTTAHGGLPAGLAGTPWRLRSYRDPAGATIPAATSNVATLDFTAAGLRVSGSTGCNQFSGTYASTGSQLSIDLGPMTQMACTGAGQPAQEQAVVKNLAAVTSYRISSSALALIGKGNAVLLTYTAGIAGLEGTSWTATGVNNGKGAVDSTALTEHLTATFGAASAFSGNDGCNNLSGTWTATGATGLKITGLMSTMKGCADDVNALAAEYTAALGQVSSYTIAGDVLTLRSSDGAMQVTYRLGA